MAITPVNIGSGINAGDGEAIRSAFQKINAMMAEIYATLTNNGIDGDFLLDGDVPLSKFASIATGRVLANLTGGPAPPQASTLSALALAMPPTGLIGEVREFAGPLLPALHVWADGSAKSRSTYAALLNALTAAVNGNVSNGSSSITSLSADLTGLGLEGAAIEGPGLPAGATVVSITATTLVLSTNANAPSSGAALRLFPHGNGDGSTTFNVPDRKGRAGFGRDNMGGTAANRLTDTGTGNPGIKGARLGASGGADRHVLTVAQLAQHSHGLTQAIRGSGAVQMQTAAGGAGNLPNTDVAGGNEAHPQVPPASVTNFIVFAGV